MAASLSHLPLQVGSTVMASAGRAALWIIARYMKAPLPNTAIAALVVTSALAGSNALYGQTRHHPSPLFAPVEQAHIADSVEPVVPVARPKKFASTTPSATPTVTKKVAVPVEKPVETAADNGPLGNKDVYAVQRKLEQMHYFTGTVDGYYGPQTARAIKKFEQANGLKQTGQLTADISAMILAAPLDGTRAPQGDSDVAPEATASPEAVAPRVTAEPAGEAGQQPALSVEGSGAASDPDADAVTPDPVTAPAASTALPTPKPLADTVAVSTKTASISAEQANATLLGRPVPKDADQAFKMATSTAEQAFDTIAGGVQQMVNGGEDGADGAEDGGDAADPIGSIAAQSSEPAVASTPTPGVPLALNEEPAKPGTPIKVLDTNATPDQIEPKFSPSDPVVVAKVQRGLASLGFLHAAADGVPGETTAKAIRNFEVFYNYQVTGRITPDLLDLLVQNGAAI